MKDKEKVNLQDQELLKKYHEEQAREKEKIEAAKRAV